MDEPGVLKPSRRDRRGGRGWLAWVVPLVVATAAFAGVFNLTTKLLPGPKPQRIWSASDGSPVPIDFLFLMFPVDDNVPLYDAPGGKQVAVLQRALGNIYGEVRDAKWVQVPPSEPGGKATSVRVSDLRYLSPAVAGTMPPLKEGAPRPPNYVGNFAAAYRARKPEETRGATYAIHTTMPENVRKEAAGRTGGRFATLRLQEGGNRREFHAMVTADNAIPLAIDQLYEGSKFTASITRWLIAGSVALVVAFAVWLGVIALWQGRGTPPIPSGPVGEPREPL